MSRGRSNHSANLWGGRFRKPPDPSLTRLSRAGAGHARLVPQDVRGGKAHAAELMRAGLLSPDEHGQITRGLDEIAAGCAAGRLTLAPDDEDVHAFVERALVASIGVRGPSSGPAARATTRPSIT